MSQTSGAGRARLLLRVLTVQGVQVRVPLRPLSLTEQHARHGGSEGSRIGKRPLREGRVLHG